MDRLGSDVRRGDERLAGEQFEKDAAEGIHITAGIHMAAAVLDLLRGDVTGRADKLVHASEIRLGDVSAFDDLGDAEVDDLRRDTIAFIGDEDVRGLQIAVDDALLMSVMHRLADGDEKL